MPEHFGSSWDPSRSRSQIAIAMDPAKLDAVVVPNHKSEISRLRWEIRRKQTKKQRRPLTDFQILFKKAQIMAYEKRRVEAGGRPFRAPNGSPGLDGSTPEADQAEVPGEFAVAEELIPDALYIMENPRLPGEIKIGRSHNPEERARQLSSGQNFRIVVKRSYGEKGFLEKTLHHKLKHRRVEQGAGIEWFRVSVEQADILVQAAVIEDNLAKL
jgi:hypothetical protein